MAAAMSDRKRDTRRWGLLAFAFVSTASAGGLVYGWPALRQELVNSSETLTEKQLGGIFTVGAWSTQGIGRFFAGLARDRFGTRVTACICFLCVTAGTLGLALSAADNVASLTVSMFGVGLGSGVQLCLQPVAGLFPQSSANIMFVLTGAFMMSGLVFLALTSVADKLSRRAAFLGYAMFLLLLTLVAWVLLPRGVSFVLQKDGEDAKTKAGNKNSSEATNKYGPQSTTSLSIDDFEDSISISENDHQYNDDSNDAEEDIDEDKEESGSNSVLEEEETILTTVQQLKTFEYFCLCTWFSVCVVPLQYYVGSIGFQLEQKGDDTGFYTDLFSIIYAAVAVVTPFAGYLADVFGLGISQGIAAVLTAGSLFFLASNNMSLNVHAIGMILYGMARIYVYSLFFANLGKRFGFHNFGTLAGLGLLISAIVSLLQYPLIMLASEGHNVAVNIGCGAVLLALLPYCAWLYRRERSGGALK